MHLKSSVGTRTQLAQTLPLSSTCRFHDDASVFADVFHRRSLYLVAWALRILAPAWRAGRTPNVSVG